VITLDVSEAFETVTSVVVSERPGTLNGPLELGPPPVTLVKQASLGHVLPVYE
jgi:hypothetical protein